MKRNYHIKNRKTEQRNDKGKEKVDLVEAKKEIGKIWIKKDVIEFKDESTPLSGANTSSRK